MKISRSPLLIAALFAALLLLGASTAQAAKCGDAGCRGGAKKASKTQTTTVESTGALGTTTTTTDLNVDETYEWPIPKTTQKSGKPNPLPSESPLQPGQPKPKTPVAGVPEPTAALLFGAGILVAGVVTRRR